jgi:hypothetical protein
MNHSISFLVLERSFVKNQALCNVIATAVSLFLGSAAHMENHDE